MTEAERGQGARPLEVPEHVLFQQLRQYETSAYCNILRAFIGQGLVLDAARNRMLEDLRSMLHIPETRHTAEHQAAEADRTLQIMKHKKISDHRQEYTDRVLTLGGEPPGGSAGTDNSDTDAGDTHGGPPMSHLAKRKRDARRRDDMRKKKQQRTVGMADASGLTASSSATQRLAEGGVRPSLTELDASLSAVQVEINDLHQQLDRALDPAKKTMIKARLEAKQQELDYIIGELSAESPEEVPEEEVRANNLEDMTKKMQYLQQKINELSAELKTVEDSEQKAKIKEKLDGKIDELDAIIGQLGEEEEEEEEDPGAGDNLVLDDLDTSQYGASPGDHSDFGASGGKSRAGEGQEADEGVVAGSAGAAQGSTDREGADLEVAGPDGGNEAEDDEILHQMLDGMDGVQELQGDGDVEGLTGADAEGDLDSDRDEEEDMLGGDVTEAAQKDGSEKLTEGAAEPAKGDEDPEDVANADEDGE